MLPKQVTFVAVGSLLVAILSCDSSSLTDAPFEGNGSGWGSVEGIVAAGVYQFPGVTVTVTGNLQRSVTTDSVGAFRFSDLPSGTYWITITDYPEWAEFVSTEIEVRVSSNLPVTRVDFRGTIEGTASIIGTVTVDGMALSDVALTLSGPARDTAVSDTEGTFAFGNLGEGRYSLAISGFDSSIHVFPATEQSVITRKGRRSEVQFRGGNVPLDDAPPEPVSLEAAAVDSSTVVLRWSDPAEAGTQIRLERASGGSGAWIQIGTFPKGTTTVQDFGLAAHTDYRYRIRACMGKACSGYCEEALATTPGSGHPNLTIAAMYVTQGVQTSHGEVPIVAGRDALLRVFPTTTGLNSLRPSVRIRMYHGETLVRTETVVAATPSVPTSLDDGDLDSSWDLPIPAALLYPGLAIVAEVDPDNEVTEPDESDNTYPRSGVPLALDIRTVSPLALMFVPVRQGQLEPAGRVSAQNTSEFLTLVRKLYPIARESVEVHAEYTTSAPDVMMDNGNGAWGIILSEINALRVVEGSSRHYYGVVHTGYSSGVGGVAYQGWPVAVGRDGLPGGALVMAHELGHNWNRAHSPGCGVSDVDPMYPYLDGRIGTWGTDLDVAEQKSPTVYYDLMSYCGPRWISDYTYEAVLDFRQTGNQPGPVSSPEPSLLVWGRIEDGHPILEPAFEVTTAPSLPARPGAYAIEGLGSGGDGLFTLSFDPVPVSDGEIGEGHFAFAVPLSSFPEDRLRGLMVSGAGSAGYQRAVAPEAKPVAAPPETLLRPASDRMVEVRWSSSTYPMVMVRDPSTGQVLTIARGGEVRLLPSSHEVELIFSDGVRSPEVVRRSWR